MRRADYDQAVEASGSPSTAASRSSRSGNTGRPGARPRARIKRRWGWDELMQAASTARRGPKAEARRARRRELLLTLRRAREQLGRWPTAGEWEAPTNWHVSRRSYVRNFGSWRRACRAAARIRP